MPTPAELAKIGNLNPGPRDTIGSRGKAVVSLQRFLGVTPDGLFGPDTKAALIKFQKDNNIPGIKESAYGNFGPIMREFFRTQSVTSPTPRQESLPQTTPAPSKSTKPIPDSAPIVQPQSAPQVNTRAINPAPAVTPTQSPSPFNDFLKRIEKYLGITQAPAAEVPIPPRRPLEFSAEEPRRIIEQSTPIVQPKVEPKVNTPATNPVPQAPLLTISPWSPQTVFTPSNVPNGSVRTSPDFSLPTPAPRLALTENQNTIPTIADIAWNVLTDVAKNAETFLSNLIPWLDPFIPQPQFDESLVSKGAHPVLLYGGREAAKTLPSGYKAKVISDSRTESESIIGSGSYHVKRFDSHGNLTPGGTYSGAIDIQIFDPQGRPLENGFNIPNKAGIRESFQIYREFMQNMHRAIQAQYPELEGKGRWGGYFRSGWMMDLMHYDIGLSKNTQAGNWDQGLFTQQAEKYDLLDQVGKGMQSPYEIARKFEPKVNTRAINPAPAVTPTQSPSPFNDFLKRIEKYLGITQAPAAEVPIPPRRPFELGANDTRRIFEPSAPIVQQKVEPDVSIPVAKRAIAPEQRSIETYDDVVIFMSEFIDTVVKSIKNAIESILSEPPLTPLEQYIVDNGSFFDSLKNRALIRETLPSRPPVFNRELLPQTDPVMMKPLGTLTDDEIEDVLFNKTIPPINKVMEKLFAAHGRVYNAPDVVLFDGQSFKDATEIFPGDKSIGSYQIDKYIDTYIMRDKFGNLTQSGNFNSTIYIDIAQIKRFAAKWRDARPIILQATFAHELGHHLQQATGISDKLNLDIKSKYPRIFSHDLDQTIIEQQADYLEGTILALAGLLHKGDPENIYYANNAIYGFLAFSMTHGSSLDRTRATYDGMLSADIETGLARAYFAPQWNLDANIRPAHSYVTTPPPQSVSVPILLSIPRNSAIRETKPSRALFDIIFKKSEARIISSELNDDLFNERFKNNPHLIGGEALDGLDIITKIAQLAKRASYHSDISLLRDRETIARTAIDLEFRVNVMRNAIHSALLKTRGVITPELLTKLDNGRVVSNFIRDVDKLIVTITEGLYNTNNSIDTNEIPSAKPAMQKPQTVSAINPAPSAQSALPKNEIGAQSLFDQIKSQIINNLGYIMSLLGLRNSKANARPAPVPKETPISDGRPPEPPDTPLSENEILMAKQFGLSAEIDPGTFRKILPPDPGIFPETLPTETDMFMRMFMRVRAGSLTDAQIDTLVARALPHLDKYWARVFADRGLTYNPPRVVMYRGKSPISDSSVPVPPPHWYGPLGDPVSGITYIDRRAIRDLTKNWNQSNASDVQMILAHEVGHHVARQLGMYKGIKMSEHTVIIEQQAQYLAGVSLREAGLLYAGFPEHYYYASARYGADMLEAVGATASIPGYVYPTARQMSLSIYEGMTEVNIDKGLKMLR